MKQNQPNQDHLHYGISLKLYFENKAFGPGMSALLRGVEETGSLQGAAQGMNMAYSKAWSMIKKVEEGLGFQLIERYGARGSKLTEDGEEFLKLYDVYDKKVEAYADKVFRETFKDF